MKCILGSRSLCQSRNGLGPPVPRLGRVGSPILPLGSPSTGKQCRRPIADGVNRRLVGRRAATETPPKEEEQDPSTGPDFAHVDWKATGPCFAFPAVGGLLFGYDIGATSGILLNLTDPQLSGTTWYNLTPLQTGLVVSLSLLGALGGSLVTLAAGNKLGRKTELLLAAGLYGTSAVITASSGGLPQLLVGRVMYGLGVGFAMHAAPAYIAETAPASVRGLLISLKEAAIVGGILLGYAVAYIFDENVAGWRDMCLTAAPLALLLGIGTTFLPESPRWLLLNGRPKEEAKVALLKAEGSSQTSADAEIESIARGVAKMREEQAAQGVSGDNPLTLLTQKRYSQPLIIGCSLMLFQQMSGQPSVLYYASKILQDAGFPIKDAAGSAVLIGSFKVVMTLVAVAYVDNWGRRPLLLSGISCMVLSLLILGAGQTDWTPDYMTTWGSVAGLMLFVGGYQVSFGPIAWLLLGELFPLAVRGQAIAIGTFVNFASNFLVTLALPPFQSTFGLSSTYFSFAAVSVLSLVSIYFTVPETKGKTLEQIESMWGPAMLPAGSSEAEKAE